MLSEMELLIEYFERTGRKLISIKTKWKCMRPSAAVPLWPADFSVHLNAIAQLIDIFKEDTNY